jgi:hypothetical protein
VRIIISIPRFRGGHSLHTQLNAEGPPVKIRPYFPTNIPKCTFSAKAHNYLLDITDEFPYNLMAVFPIFVLTKLDRSIKK